MKQVTSPSQLKQTKTYQIVYPNGTKKTLGKFIKIKDHEEQHLMSYGSPTVLPKKIIFDHHTVMDIEVFPRNEWSRLNAPVIEEVSSPSKSKTGGATYKQKQSRKKHRRRRSIRRYKTLRRRKRNSRRR